MNDTLREYRPDWIRLTVDGQTVHRGAEPIPWCFPERYEHDVKLQGDWSTVDLRFFRQGDRVVERLDGYRFEVEGRVTIEPPRSGAITFTLDPEERTP